MLRKLLFGNKKINQEGYDNSKRDFIKKGVFSGLGLMAAFSMSNKLANAGIWFMNDGTHQTTAASGGGGTGITWQTVKTSNFTATASQGYFVDTTSSAITVTLPASATQGDRIYIIDYAGTFATNNATLYNNGLRIQGSLNSATLSTNRQVTQLVYSDATMGWELQNLKTTKLTLKYSLIGGSALFDGSAGYLTRTPSSSVTSTTWTYSVWLKISDITNTKYLLCNFSNNGNSPYTYLVCSSTAIQLTNILTPGSTPNSVITTNGIYRDPSSWYHVVFVWDTTNATQSLRSRLYINGISISQTQNGSGTAATGPNLNDSTKLFQSGQINYINHIDFATTPRSFHMAEANFIDGLALSPSDFGEFNSDNYWVSKKYSGLYGTNGFYLDFSDNTNLGKDVSGNGNHWTKTGTITATNDSPTNDDSYNYGNYATLNPLDKNATYVSLSKGNLVYTTTNNNFWIAKATLIVPTSGKWAVKGTHTNTVNLNPQIIGFVTQDFPKENQNPHLNSNSVGWYSNGTVYNAGSSLGVVAATYTTNDIIEILYDRDAATLKLYKNSLLSYTVLSVPSGANCFFATAAETSGTAQWTIDFGQNGYTPSDILYKTLTTQNFPAPTVSNPDTEYFSTTISHTNGSTTNITLPWNTITSATMIRIRQANGINDWYCYDTKRGGTKYVLSNSQAVEGTHSDSAFSGTTFTMSSAFATGTYLIEAFREGEWFQIITYTGTGSVHTESFGATLSAEVGLALFKCLGATYNWVGYHVSVGAIASMAFDNTNDVATSISSIYFNNTAPTTSLITVGTGNGINASTQSFIGYIWANGGPYKFGSLTHNGSTDGTFVNLNGCPQTWFDKRTDLASSWVFWADPVVGYNPNGKDFALESTSAPPVNTLSLDFISTGVKYRDSRTTRPLIYGAFGIRPIQGDKKDMSQGRAK